MKVGICSLGCKVNQYEADACARLFEEAGFTVAPFEQRCDVYVVNTCTITNTGARKSRQMLRRAKAQNAAAVVVAMGCYAQLEGEGLLKDAGVDVVIGTSGRHTVVERVKEAQKGKKSAPPGRASGDRAYEEDLTAGKSSERSRAYIKIQDGCGNFCSYCIVPYTRGPMRSRDFAAITAECARFAQMGFREIVLTGINISHYGEDTGKEKLIDVIGAVCAQRGIERVRLGSVSPELFTGGFIGAVSGWDKLCRHFHISLQSGSGAVLERMNRRYTPQDYLDVLDRIRERMPDAAVTTDIIVGFPGETDAEFEETLDFVRRARFSKIHVFPYSKRDKTAAARLAQIAPAVKTARARALSALAREETARFETALLGSRAKVLFEQKKDGRWEGFCENYVRVFAKSEADLSGKICPVLLCARKTGKIFVKILDKEG